MRPLIGNKIILIPFASSNDDHIWLGIAFGRHVAFVLLVGPTRCEAWCVTAIAYSPLRSYCFGDFKHITNKKTVVQNNLTTDLYEAASELRILGGFDANTIL